MSVEVLIGQRVASIHEFRVRHQRGGWYVRVLGRFSDTGVVFNMPKSRFDTWVKDESKKVRGGESA